ncbi:hypothetical protein ACET3Z_000730 [Daucus carota]
MAKLKEALSIKIDGSPNIGSQQGSCSKGGLENVLELTAVKKKLDLNESPKGEDAEINFQEGYDEEKNKGKEKGVAELKSSGEENGVEYLVVEDKDVEVAEENEVDQAVGTFIAWPRNMLREVKANSDRVKSRVVKGVPAQTGTTDCGLFVMLYMREICIDKELKFASKWARRSNLVFDSDDLNEIRSAWAKYFMRQHAS